MGGLDTILEFWEAIERSGATISWKLKVILVGAVRAGKTSLARGMIDGEPRLCDEDERTKGVDVHVNKPCKPDAANNVELVFWDFAGHPEYYSTHQLFLSEGALHLLVVDLKRFSEHPSERNNVVGIWIDALQCRVPEAKVLVVANKFDGWAGDHETILGELRRAVEEHVEAKRAEQERASQRSPTSSGTPRMIVILGVELVSAAEAKSLVGLRRKLGALASTGAFPSVGQQLPVSWVRVRAVLDAKRLGQDPAWEASLIGADAQRRPAAPRPSGDPMKSLRWTDAVREWDRVVRALKLEREVGMGPLDEFVRAFNFCRGVGRSGKAENVFKSAVGVLLMEGTMLLSGEVLYVEPTWINELLRAILDHELTDETKKDFWEKELKKFACDPGEYSKLKAVHDKFCSTGTLTIGYLRFLWRNVLAVCDEDIFRSVLASMSHHGVMFRGTPARNGIEEIERKFDENSNLFVPVRLPSKILPSNLSEREVLQRSHYREELNYNIHQSYVPPSLLGLLLTRFLACEGVQFYSCWSRGAAFAMGGPKILVYLNDSREEVSDKANVTIQVFGQEFTGELVNAVKMVQGIIGVVFTEHFGGLFVELEGGKAQIVRGVNAGLERIENLQEHTSSLEDIISSQAKLLSRLQESLNTGLSDLGKVAESLKDESTQGLGQVKRVLDEFLLEMDKQKEANRDAPTECSERLRSLTSLVERDDGVMGRLDFLVAMVMAERAEKISAPRFVCVLPPWEFTEKRGLSSTEMDPSVWTKRFSDWGDDCFKAGKGLFETELRVFPVCAFSGELVPCGHEGHGYQVKRARKWVRNATSVANALTSAMVRPIVQAEPWTAPVMAAAQLGAKHAAKKAQVRKHARSAGKLRNEGIMKDGLDQVQELTGPDYESVRVFIHGMEIRTREEINSKMRKVHTNRRGDPSIPHFVCFEEKMVQVQARDGVGATQWVLIKHESAWYNNVRRTSFSSSEG